MTPSPTTRKLRSLYLLAGVLALAAIGTIWLMSSRNNAGNPNDPTTRHTAEASTRDGITPSRNAPVSSKTKPPDPRFDPAHPLAAGEYKRLHQEALVKEAETNPTIKRLLEMHARYAGETEKLRPTIQGIIAWRDAGTTPEEKQARKKVFQQAMAITNLLSRTYQWREDELRTLLQPDETFTARQFAKSLVAFDIDPSALLGSPAEGRAAVDGIHQRLYDKLEQITTEAGAPTAYFNQQTYDRMINASLGDAFHTKAEQLSSPETRKLAEAESQMRVGGRLMKPGER